MKRFVYIGLITLAVVTPLRANFTYEYYYGSFGSSDGYFSSPSGVAAVSGGEYLYVYVADTGNHRLQRIRLSYDSGSQIYRGSFSNKWGSYGTGNGEFKNPTGVDYSTINDYVYVADQANHRIQYFDAVGSFLGKWGSYGNQPGSFKRPWDVEVSPRTGYVYVADSGNDRVQYFTSTGSYLGGWGVPGGASGDFRNPRGIAVTRGTHVYVTDTGNNRVQYFTGKGIFLGEWGSRGSSDGLFKDPSGITYAQDMEVFVADPGNSRGQMFTASGSFQEKYVTTSYITLEKPVDIDVWEHGGRFVLADSGRHRIVWYNRNIVSVSPASLGRVKALFR
jgi:DNA-binding beta-propeller fold protein YncE